MKKTKEPYGTAAGPMAVFSSFRYAQKTSGIVKGLRVFLDVNQQRGFDCPGCAWPDPDHRSIAELCENGARAVAHEADARRCDADFFARHSIASLRSQTDHWLEQQGRLTVPLLKEPGASHYRPISYADAYARIGAVVRAERDPNRVALYTSGRASNEAAFLYQLYARTLGTNNLPDCSNMCHESSGKGLGNTIGIGKGTVQLSDFDEAECILVIGQNPGTNHPRMLSTLQAASDRGCAVVSINPLREAALVSFAHPQKGLGFLGKGTKISSHYLQVRVGGDIALLSGFIKGLIERDAVDTAFISEHTAGFAALRAQIEAMSWDQIVASSGVAFAEIDAVVDVLARSTKTIACWAMGITQHEHGVDNVRAIVNLLLLQGNIGKRGAGVCPVRGHSNVQGDRTMGIVETPSEAFL
jgi:molybdopterin-dependent oxidoreductase alpha subunit